MPDFRIDAFIAGAEKAGTTSLGYYISQHPGVHSHFQWSERSSTQVREFSVFLDDRWRGAEFFEKEYLAAFGGLPEEHQIVVAKNVGIMHRDGAANNLKEYSPDCKLVVSLRNPVDRAYSSFWYQRYRGEETLVRFEDAIGLEMQSPVDSGLSRHRQYLAKGCYLEQLIALYDLFGKERVHVILIDDLKSSQDSTLNGVFSFLGLPDCEVNENIVRNPAKGVRSTAIARWINRDSLLKDIGRRVLSRSKRRRFVEWLRLRNSVAEQPVPMDPRTRKMLLEYFRPHNRRLGESLGRSLSHWDA